MGAKVHLIIVTDCGGSDEGRYGIAARRCFYDTELYLTFFGTESMNTLHSGFTGAAHALSTIDHFGPLRSGEQIGLLVNAAPRHGTENGKVLRGEGRHLDGEEIYALKLKNGVWVVGPNAGWNLYFLQEQVVESYLVKDTSGRSTPFRSMEVMIPALAKVLGVAPFPHLLLEPKRLVVEPPESGVFVADRDDHGNLYLVQSGEDESWVPTRGESRTFKIGTRIARLRHVDGIFAGATGEQTLTTGSLKLGGKPVWYVVVVGASAYALFGNPPIGSRVIVEPD